MTSKTAHNISDLGLAKAEKVKRFIESLTFTSGRWAGQPFALLDWQWEDVVLPLFGTLKPNGKRQYRICYIEIPKKNGKTEFGAALALYLLCADGENTPRVYSAASDRDQATLVYTPAATMVRNNDTLQKKILVRDSLKRLVYAKNNGVYQVLSSEVATKHGLNPSGVIVDEIHAFRTDELWRVLTSGTDYAREQQVIVVLTTAGIWNRESIWWRLREKARQIKEGLIEDPSFLPVLYIADPDPKIDDPADEKLWIRVNPSLGQIFSLEKIREDYATASQDPVEEIDFKRFRLNIPVKQQFKWMPMLEWDACGQGIDWEALKGKECYGGLDMSTKIDLTAFVLLFPPQDGIDKHVVVPHFYCPEDTILKRSKEDAVHYDTWVDQGFMHATPGNVIDEDYIRKDVLEMKELYKIQEIGFDPKGAVAISNWLHNQAGIETVEVRQGALSMSEPAKEIFVKVMTHMLEHDNHPVLRWCADNTVMQGDANENIRPMKDKATDRIDGIVALINAWNRITNVEDLGPSVYEQRGFEII